MPESLSSAINDKLETRYLYNMSSSSRLLLRCIGDSQIPRFLFTYPLFLAQQKIDPKNPTSNSSSMADGTTFLSNPHDKDNPFICVSFPDVIKLTPSNYINWLAQIKSLLFGYDLLRFVDGTHPAPAATITTGSPPMEKPNPSWTTWCHQDRLLCGALLTTLLESVASLVSRAKTFAELWSKLKTAFATPSRGHIKQLKDRLRSSTKGAQSVQEYMHSVKVITDQLASLGNPISDEDVTDYVLRGLDSSYRLVVEGVNAKDASIPFDNLLEKLRVHEFTLAHSSVESPAPITALTAQTKKWGGFQPNNGGNRNNINTGAPSPGASSSTQPGNRKPFLGKCQYCNIRGHVLSYCSLFRQHFPQARTPQQLPQVHTAVNNASSSPSFLLDRGATNHVTNDLHNLAIYHPYSGPESLLVGDGSGPTNLSDQV